MNSPVTSRAHAVVLQEQVILDRPSGFMVTIWRTAEGEGRLRIAEGPAGPTRDLQFDADGALVDDGVPAESPHHVKLVL